MKSYTGASVRLTTEPKMCFLVLGGATNFYWWHGLFFAWKKIFLILKMFLIFHLKKGYGVPLKATSDFSEKISLKRGAINCFECNVKHFDVHLMLTNLTLVSNKNKTRQRYLSYFIQSGKTDRFPLI